LKLNHTAIQATQYWLKEIVIGENFCPFAKREFDRQKIRFVTVAPASLSELQALLSKEYALLDNDPKSDWVTTTLVIFTPRLDLSSATTETSIDVQNFDDFLLITEEANWQLTKLGYAGTYQLASFHPQYLFAGESTENPSHYTNRSPYPTLHIIREDSIDRALKTFKQPDTIPENNITRANQLGVQFFQHHLAKALRLAR
jgi:hypothetical protein